MLNHLYTSSQEILLKLKWQGRGSEEDRNLKNVYTSEAGTVKTCWPSDRVTKKGCICLFQEQRARVASRNDENVKLELH